MANRKVLINLHTSGSSAPTPADVFLGELVVAHETGKETIFTKNNAGTMIPFISCAQTKTMVDNATAGYMPKSGGTFTNDVIFGEDPTTHSSASVYFCGSTETFDSVYMHNDLYVYGEIDVSEGSAKNRIRGVADPVDDYDAANKNYVNSAITALDSQVFTQAGSYITGIAIADGKISGITEASLPTLTAVSAGTGNVVASITVNGHEITYQTASVATSEGITALSAATINLSAATQNNKTNITALSAGTIQLSADTKAAIDALAGTIASAVNYKGATATLPSNPTVGDLWIASAEINLGGHKTAEEGDFLIYNGSSWDVIEKNLDGAITGDFGSYTNGVVYSTGKHEVGQVVPEDAGVVLTFNGDELAWTGRVNSAYTSYSASTAARANKVVNPLSVSGYSSETAATLNTAISYDGSAAKSLTFGTVGNAGLNSMATTSAGLIDVEVIDCGTY